MAVYVSAPQVLTLGSVVTAVQTVLIEPSTTYAKWEVQSAG